MNNRGELSDIINWIITILFMVLLAYAIHQRFFEDGKCKDWVNNRIIEIEKNIDGTLNICRLDCSSPFENNINNIEKNEKSQINLFGNYSIPFE